MAINKLYTKIQNKSRKIHEETNSRLKEEWKAQEWYILRKLHDADPKIFKER